MLPCIKQNQVSYLERFEEHEITRNLADKNTTKLYLPVPSGLEMTFFFAGVFSRDLACAYIILICN